MLIKSLFPQAGLMASKKPGLWQLSAISKRFFMLPLLALLLVLPEISAAAEDTDETTYYYKRTKRVVSMVNNAARVLEEKGDKAFDAFAQKDSRWFQGEIYLFIYTMKGVNIFHPVQEQLVGQDLYDMKDVNGRPLIRLLSEKAENGGGWVHYMWTRPGEFIPTWKSGYARKAVMPDGREVFVGSGVYNIRTEKEFIIEMVDDAVELIREKKQAAFDAFRSDAGPFSFRDSYILVFKDDGTAVVDPAFPYLEGRNLLKYDIIRKMISRIKGKKSAWVSYRRPRPGDVNPSKKLAYLRTVTINGERYIVAADFFPPKPIWMR